jgi:hypothetical protein
MKKENELKLYLLAQSTLLHEWASLLGDKYVNALPFKWSMTDSYEQANVIAWDGLMNTKAAYYFQDILTSLNSGQSILLLQSEASTLFHDHLYLQKINLNQVRYVELPGGNILPEDLLIALEICHQKLNHV